MKNHFTDMAAHLARMRRTKGFGAHAAYRIQELEEDGSGLWVGLKDAVLESLKSYDDQQKNGG
jgi:hypothetical protein